MLPSQEQERGYFPFNPFSCQIAEYQRFSLSGWIEAQPLIQGCLINRRGCFKPREACYICGFGVDRVEPLPVSSIPVLCCGSHLVFGAVWCCCVQHHLCVVVLHHGIVLRKTTEIPHVSDAFMWDSVHCLNRECRTGLGLLGDIFIDELFMRRPLGWVCLGASSSSKHIKRTALVAAAIMVFSWQPTALHVRESILTFSFWKLIASLVVLFCPFEMVMWEMRADSAFQVQALTEIGYLHIFVEQLQLGAGRGVLP